MPKDRARYQSMIYTYRKRRDALNQKIRNWQREIKKIDEKNHKALEIIKEINIYFNVDITQRSNKPKYVLARNCYYKYGIDTGLSGFSLIRTLGGSHLQRASENRLTFTRSFKTNKTNKESYHKFKDYIEQNKTA